MVFADRINLGRSSGSRLSKQSIGISNRENHPHSRTGADGVPLWRVFRHPELRPVNRKPGDHAISVEVVDLDCTECGLVKLLSLIHI